MTYYDIPIFLSDINERVYTEPIHFLWHKRENYV